MEKIHLKKKGDKRVKADKIAEIFTKQVILLGFYPM